MLNTVEHITYRLSSDLSTAALAARAGISTRHLSLFRTDPGPTPARYVRRARTEAAAQLLSTTSLPLTRVAKRCGFATTESLRTAFLASYGVPPSRFKLLTAG